MNKARRFCSASPSCRTLTDGGPCAVHALKREQVRGSSNARGYTYGWGKRAAAFKRRYPLCGMRPHGQEPVMSECHERHIITPAFQVDHVIPHKGNQQLFWDEVGNWQSLCAQCGARKSQAGL